MPSGSKILATYMNYARFTVVYLDVYTYTRLRVEGLCGSLDGDPSNDVKHRFTNQTHNVIGPFNKLDDNVANSWR